MFGVWSFLRQFMYTKFIVVTDDDVDVRDWKEVIWAMTTRVDPARDTLLVEHTPIDYLDFASPVVGPRQQDGHRRDEQVAGRDDARMGPADRDATRSRRASTRCIATSSARSSARAITARGDSRVGPEFRGRRRRATPRPAALLAGRSPAAIEQQSGDEADGGGHADRLPGVVVHVVVGDPRRTPGAIDRFALDSCSRSLAASSFASTCERRSLARSPGLVEARFISSSASFSIEPKSSTSFSRVVDIAGSGKVYRAGASARQDGRRSRAARHYSDAPRGTARRVHRYQVRFFSIRSRSVGGKRRSATSRSAARRPSSRAPACHAAIDSSSSARQT